MPLLVALTLAGGLSPRKTKPLGFILGHAFQLIRLKFDVMLKQFKSNTLVSLLSEIWCIEEDD